MTKPKKQAPKKQAPKKQAPKKQTRIPGTYTKVPQKLQRLAEDYVENKRQKQASGEREKTSREELIVQMKENDLTEIEINGGEKSLVLCDSIVLKIKSTKKKPMFDVDVGA